MKILLTALPLWACMPAFSQNNDSARIYYNTGLQEKAAKHWLVASKQFDQSVKQDPSFTQAYYENAMVCLEMKKTDQAKALFTKTLELEPSNTSAIRELMTLCFNYRQFAKAIELGRKCKDCPTTNRVIGISNYQLENYNEAETSLLASLAKEPNDAEAAYTLARTYLDIEEEKKSLPWFEKAVSLNPTKNSWSYELGLLYYSQDNFKKAVEMFTNAANNGYPSTKDFEENMGYALLYSGQVEKAENMLSNGNTKGPRNKEILRNMAEALYKQKQYEKSLAYCKKIMDMDPADGKALYQAGLNFLKLGEKDKGQQLCDRAIELDPSLTSLRTKKDLGSL